MLIKLHTVLVHTARKRKRKRKTTTLKTSYRYSRALCVRYIPLTTALLYWSGTADMLPITFQTIHSRRHNSITVAVDTMLCYLHNVHHREEKNQTFRIATAFSKPSQTLKNRHKAHRCFSSEAPLSLGTRLG